MRTHLIVGCFREQTKVSAHKVLAGHVAFAPNLLRGISLKDFAQLLGRRPLDVCRSLKRDIETIFAFFSSKYCG